MVPDVSTRFEVPVSAERPLSRLFRDLMTHGAEGNYAVERASLESIFLKVIRQHRIEEEEWESQRRTGRYWLRRSR